MTFGIIVDLDLTLLKSAVERRDYQLLAAANALRQNTLVVMPTALGKTIIAALLAAHHLKTHPEKKILFLAPTKPLVDQQAKRLRDFVEIDPELVLSVTGDVPPSERHEGYLKSRVIVSTPQTCEHDVLSRKLDLSSFSLIVFDEAHRAVGDYAYVFLGKTAKNAGCNVLALTASPSSRREKIEEIVSNLGISHIELRHEDDEDVRQYASPVKVHWVFVDLPAEFKSLQLLIREILTETLLTLRQGGFLETADLSKVNKKDLLSARFKAAASLPQNRAAYAGISLIAKAINLSHALELLEAQGVSALLSFLSGMKERKEKTKAVLALLEDFRIQKLIAQSDDLLSKGISHPKVERLKRIVAEQARDGKALIVFAHFKDTVASLIAHLNSLPGISAKAMVGTSGMSQKKQKALLDDFREKKFNVLVCTSVGEEGLDIPAVDTVIFYEAVPSEIRHIQRRGRAGRIRAGNAIVLAAKHTKDEAFFWIARRKERAMRQVLEEYSRDLSEARNAGKDAQKNLKEF